MEDPQIHLANKIDALLERLSKLDGDIINVSSNVNFLSKNLELYQGKLDSYVMQVNQEISKLNQTVAVHASKIHDLRDEQEHARESNSKVSLMIWGAAASLVVSVIGNVLIFFFKK